MAKSKTAKTIPVKPKKVERVERAERPERAERADGKRASDYEKSPEYQGPYIQIFAQADNFFDSSVCEKIRELIWEAMPQVEKPTMSNMADFFGIRRERFPRILEVLGMRKDFDEKKVAQVAVFNYRRKQTGKKKLYSKSSKSLND